MLKADRNWALTWFKEVFMNGLEELKEFVHDNATLSRNDLESLMMRHYHLKHAEAVDTLLALEEELNSNDPLPQAPMSLLGVLATIGSQQVAGTNSGAATMIEASIPEIERNAHLEREDRIRSGQAKR
jgi:hypothetical protein